MTQWIETLEVKEDWKLAENDTITVHEFVKRLVPKLEALKLKDIVLSKIIDEFEMFLKDENNDEDDFDEIWEQLYNWCDYHRVWVRTW